MWLPHLTRAIADGTIDVAITCGLVPDPDGVVGEVFCGEPLLAGLRPGHRLARQPAVSLADLASDVLGVPSPDLFPAWALSQQQALAAARVAPPTVILDATDLTATAWTDQPGIDWVLLINSLITPRTPGVIAPVTPRYLVPFGLHWNPEQAQTPAVAKFVHLALTTEPPPGWHTQPDHLRHQHEPASTPRRKPHAPACSPWAPVRYRGFCWLLVGTPGQAASATSAARRSCCLVPPCWASRASPWMMTE